MDKVKDWLNTINYIFILLGVYLLILGIFLTNSFAFYNYTYRQSPRIVREGLLLPKVDGVDTLLNADPLLTSSKDEVVLDLRRKVSSLLFSTLFIENPDGTLGNDVVKDYQFIDAKELILNIRDDVYWSDGFQLTATDIEFTLNSIRSLGQDTIYAGAANGNDINVTVVSPTQLKISLQNQGAPRPNASYIYELVFPILPKHILFNYTKPDINRLHLSEFGKKPITSGKFLYSNNRIEELSLVMNEKYYGEKVGFDGYTFRFYKNYDDLNTALKLRNVDIFIRNENLRDSIHNELIAENLNFAQSIKRNRKVALYFNLNAKNTSATIFNTLVIPRRALMQAISRTNIAKEMGVSLREIYGPIDQTSWAFSEEILNKNIYNPSELEKALTILGYQKQDGFYAKGGKRLSLKISYLDSEFNETLLQLLKKQLEQIGVEVILAPLSVNIVNGTITQNSFGAVVSNRDFDVLLTYVDKNQDPDIFSEWHSSRSSSPGLNFTGFSSKVADRTLSDARILSRTDERKSQYIRFQKSFYDESAPAIFLFNPSMIIYSRKNIGLFIPAEINNSSSIYNNISTWIIN